MASPREARCADGPPYQLSHQAGCHGGQLSRQERPSARSASAARLPLLVASDCERTRYGRLQQIYGAPAQSTRLNQVLACRKANKSKQAMEEAPHAELADMRQRSLRDPEIQRTAAPLKPLPEPVDLERYRVRTQTHTGCLINEYRLVA